MSLANRQPFDAFEIQKVAEYDKGFENAYCEPVMNARDQQAADEGASTQFWTVYGHRAGEGVHAISDHTSHEDALDMAHALSRTGQVDINDYSYSAEEVPA